MAAFPSTIITLNPCFFSGSLRADFCGCLIPVPPACVRLWMRGWAHYEKALLGCCSDTACARMPFPWVSGCTRECSYSSRAWRWSECDSRGCSTRRNGHFWGCCPQFTPPGPLLSRTASTGIHCKQSNLLLLTASRELNKTSSSSRSARVLLCSGSACPIRHKPGSLRPAAAQWIMAYTWQ